MQPEDTPVQFCDFNHHRLGEIHHHVYQFVLLELEVRSDPLANLLIVGNLSQNGMTISGLGNQPYVRIKIAPPPPFRCVASFRLLSSRSCPPVRSQCPPK